MNGYNRVIIIGNLTKDPESRFTPNGTQVCDFSIAINEKKDEPATFVEITAWEKTAEVCCKYLTKGKPVLIEGRLKQDTWNDKATGQKRSKLTVTADRVQFLGSGKERDADEGQPEPAQRESVPADSTPF